MSYATIRNGEVIVRDGSRSLGHGHLFVCLGSQGEMNIYLHSSRVFFFFHREGDRFLVLWDTPGTDDYPDDGMQHVVSRGHIG